MNFRFDRYEVDERRYELRRAGEVVPLPPRSFDLLRVLVRRHAELVTKAELMATVWPNLTVTKDSLPQAMMAVRRALDEDLDHPRFIQTVRGRGYRFVAEVEEIETRAEPPESARLAGPTGTLAALRDTLAQTRLDRGHIIFVIGEPGISKSRLVDELRADPAHTVVISCPAPDAELGSAPLAQLIREIGRSTDLFVVLDEAKTGPLQKLSADRR